MTKERLFVVDAFALIFRSYYAIRNIDNNAVFGFTTTLKKLIETESPEYIAVAFDTPGPSFRKQLYSEYKSNRMAPPEDLSAQVPLIKEVVDAYRIPMIEMPGYEADDIIGSLAGKAAEQGFQVVIVSGDKDLLQLVRDDSIVMYDAGKGIEYLGADGVPDHFGCRPDQVIDLLTIWGDSSDNIPGVPGVGEKGAKKLLAEYDNLDNIYNHLDDIKRKSYREGFESARDQIPLIKTLVTIKTDLDVPFDPEDLRRCDADQNRLIRLFTKLRFTSLVDGVDLKLNKISVTYPCVRDSDALASWISRARSAKRVIFDVETTSLNPLDAQLVGFALAIEPGDACYVPIRHQGQSEAWAHEAESMLKRLMADGSIAKCAHNAKYDLSVLIARGWDIAGNVDDTMLMSYLLDPNDARHGLDFLAEQKFDYKMIGFSDLCGEGSAQVTIDQVDVEKVTQYAAEDADICARLLQDMEPQLQSRQLMRVYKEIERPLVPILARMELRGVRIAEQPLSDLAEQLTAEIHSLEQQIYDQAGERFNIKSTKQLGEILFEKLELPVLGKTAKTKSYSTSQQVLDRLAAMGHALPQLLNAYRSLTKLMGTYIEKLPKLVNPSTGRVHSSFNQFVAATGRLSSTDPNLQNIPIRTEVGREIRAAFVTDPGWVLIAADYSQIELRILAHYSQDPTLIDGFKKGEDIHRRTAAEIMDVDQDAVTDSMRRAAKSINFGLIYGMGEFRLSQELGIPRKEARAYMETYFAKMAKVPAFTDQVIKEARKHGEVRTLFGRVRPLPEINSRNKNLQRRGERLAVNTLIQGSAAEVIKLAMARFDQASRAQNLPSHLILQVHDELVVECAAGAQDDVLSVLREAMENAYPFDVPLTVDFAIANNWKEAKG